MAPRTLNASDGSQLLVCGETVITIITKLLLEKQKHLETNAVLSFPSEIYQSLWLDHLLLRVYSLEKENDISCQCIAAQQMSALLRHENFSKSR